MKTGAHRRRVGLDVLIDWPSRDVFEREVRLTAARDAGVVEPGDVRMREAREDLPLADEPLRELRGLPGSTRQLEGDETVEHAVRPARQPDRSHAAVRDLPEDRCTARPSRAGCRRRRRRLVPDLVAVAVAVVDLRDRIQKAGRAGRTLMPQHRAETRSDAVVLRRQAVDPSRPVRRGQVERLVQQAAQCRPYIDVHGSRVRHIASS